MDLLQKDKLSRSKSQGSEKETGKPIHKDLFAFLDLIPFPVIYINKNIRYEYVNKAFAEWYETKSENIIGKTIREFIGPESYVHIEAEVKKALSGEIVNYETEIPYKDTCRYIQVTHTPEFDGAGNIKGYLALLQDITEKKKSAKESERKQLELEDYVDNASIGLHWVDAEGKIIWANKAELDMLGYSAEEYIGHFISEFHCDKKKVEDILSHLSNNKTIHQYEVEMKCRDGSVRTVLINSNVLWEDGKFIHTRCFTADITAQKTNFNALQESEQRYRNLIHSLPAAIYTTDQNGYITMYNDAAAELWGRRPEVGKDMWCGSWKIYEADGITQVPLSKCPMAITLKEKHKVISNNPFIVERPDGRRKYFIPYPEPIFDSEGNMTGALSMLVDVTESKLAEVEKSKLAAIVQSSDDAIIGKTLEGIITSWNYGAQKLFGYTEEEMMGQPVTKLIPEDRLDEEPQILQRLRKGEKVEHFETKRVTKNGKIIDISLTISPIKALNGNITGASKIARDITERKKIEEINARLAAIVQSSDDAIIGKTLEGIITSWNYGAQKLFGYTEEEMIGQSVTKLIPDDRLAEEPQILERLRKGEKVEHFETKRITKQKKLLDISLTISPIKDSTGKIIGVSKIARDITLQKETERLMHENEERFRMAVETTNLGTWEYNPHSFKLFCSPESRKICGLPGDVDPDFELLFHYIFKEDKDYFLEQITEAINPVGDGKFDLQLRFHRYNDKEVRWVRAQGKVFFNANRFPERLIGTMLDITEEKTKELELKESVELFQTMADNVPAMIWMSGTDKFEDYFNKTWLLFTGRTLEQEGNEGWLEGVHPDDVQKCMDTYNASFKEQKGFYSEYRLRRNDGEYRWISDNSVPRFSADGEFLGFISACIDIDDQKRFREKIQESELLFKTISNASPAALWMTNENEENIFVSDTWLKWTGTNFNEVINRGWAQSVIEEDRESIVNEFRECFKQRKYFKAEFRFVRTDGELRWALTEGYPFYNFNEEFSGFAGSVTDITEIKKLEQRKDDFIKMASHELKTPITSINGYVQLLMNIYNEADEQRLHLSKQTVKSSLTTISKQVVKLTRLISELLDLSKIESGKLELHKTEFDLADLVEETVQDMRQTASKHAIILHNDFEGKIFADKDRIAQVLLNLLTNAIKYSPDADNVEVFVENNKKLAIIKVKDFGIGIDQKDHLKIFERFYRAEGKSEQTFPGFGIGLFIASEIVHRHNGTINVKSEKGKGSEFIVTLPVQFN